MTTAIILKINPDRLCKLASPVNSIAVSQAVFHGLQTPITSFNRCVRSAGPCEVLFEVFEMSSANHSQSHTNISSSTPPADLVASLCVRQLGVKVTHELVQIRLFEEGPDLLRRRWWLYPVILTEVSQHMQHHRVLLFGK
jgi:hypothetical protein